MFPLRGLVGLEQIAWLVPTRWAYAMAAVTGGFPPPGSSVGGAPAPPQDPFWDHSAFTWWLDLVALTGLSSLFLIGTGYALVRLKPRRP